MNKNMEAKMTIKGVLTKVFTDKGIFLRTDYKNPSKHLARFDGRWYWVKPENKRVHIEVEDRGKINKLNDACKMEKQSVEG